MVNEPSTKPSFSTSRKWSIGFIVVVASIAVLALVVMANYLGVRHDWRFQLSDRAQVKLSPQTTSLLQSLTNQIKVTVFFDAHGEEELEHRERDLGRAGGRGGRRGARSDEQLGC